MINSAFINAIAEEGSKADAVRRLRTIWAELCAARDEIARLREALEATRFLISRLDEWSADNLADENCRDWFGHVEPAIDRAREALAPTDNPIDWDKPVRTLEGNPARVICADYRGADGRCEHPILAVVTYPEGVEVIGAYTREGEHHLCYTGEMDLINREESK